GLVTHLSSPPSACATRSAFAVRRPSLRRDKLVFAFRKVLDEEESALAGTDYIEIAVPVDIYHRDLHPPAHAAAVVDYMFDPLDCRRLPPSHGGGVGPDEFIPINAQRLLFAGIAAVVGHEPLASDDVRAAVAVQVHHR